MTEGEVPLPLQLYFDEEPIDLSGWQVVFVIERDGENLPINGQTTWANESEGLAQYEWGVGDIAVADGREWSAYECQFWAWTNNPVRRLASAYVWFSAHKPAGTPPSF